MSALHGVTRTALSSMADDLRSGSIVSPISAFSLRSHLSPPTDEIVAAELQAYIESGMTPQHLAVMLRLIAEERRSAQQASDRVDLVWTGPETAGTRSRDTVVVVRELFERARRSVLVAGYAVAQGKHVFEPLARRMDEDKSLQVRMFLNVPRLQMDRAPEPEVVRNFVVRFLADNWPGKRKPEIFYDPRALSSAPRDRASLHAKCVVVDLEYAFVTSANLTEAGQEKNIEVGVLIHDAVFARSLAEHFEALITHGLLQPAGGP